MKLNAAEKKLLVKILENTVQRFEPEDLIHMIKGPKYKIVLDHIYDECFRPHIKYSAGLLNPNKELTNLEHKIITAIWEKVSSYLNEELEER